ncbi:DUF1353 domain-containing protein [Shewanella sp. 3_MG-2023]|uniref:DUF1353 domain-containing protein n=1 Tax=Shewanella sp. 3_MG-2023 TaxID=3062635 RepID=UPI0026E2AB65|nr:DUF1353 domain-containing protein [Shewanella sp. 3_MG-2023]MDO6774345.1 DUF1353 domain-containing protein [Shewanella sp. 3_MG-2023]
MKYIYILLSITFSSLVTAEPEEYFGEYQGAVKTEWLEEGRKMKLLEDFNFTDPNEMVWLAPKDRVIDGASIPKFVWSIIGSPFSGKYRNASVIHDIACEDKVRTWESVHLAFYYAMRASGVNSIKSKIMYAAVYHKGPRWPISKKVLVREMQAVKTLDPSPGITGHKWISVEIPAVYEVRVIAPSEQTLNEEQLEGLISKLENSNVELSIEDIQNYSVQ